MGDWDKRMDDAAPTNRPLVSIIIPVYNVEDYVRHTLDSVLNQGLGLGQIEVIAVDDGSTDDSGRILDAYAAQYDYFVVRHQENSGGPGGPRNRGIEIASGKYLFFLDADDELTENALRDLVRVAESEGSDVVLGKGEGVNGRVVPGPVFRATKLDADLIDDSVYRTLSPWKLFRHSLIESKQIRFSETMRIGEDQPFVARAYLNAEKISVLSDRPYARLRRRDDGTNVTSTSRSVHDYMELAHAIVGVIVSESEPGRIRDGMLARPLKRTLNPVLRARLLRLPNAEQSEVVRSISKLVGPYYTEDVAQHLTGLDRIKMDCAVSGDVDTLRELISWESQNQKQLLTLGPAGIRYDVPEHLLGVIAPEKIESPPTVLVVNLRDVEVVDGKVVVTSEASVSGLPRRAPHVFIRLRGRQTGSEIDAPGVWLEAGESKGEGRVFTCEIDVLGMDEDVWDLFVVQQFFEEEYVKRLGAQRAKHIDVQPQYIYSGTRAYAASYFTKGRGFLALDVGLKIRAHRLPIAQIVGFIPDALGVTILVSTSSITSEQVTLNVDAGRRPLSGRRNIAGTRLSSGIYAVRLAPGEAETTATLSVENDAGKAQVTLADGLVMPSEKSPVSLEVMPGRDGIVVARSTASRPVKAGISGRRRRKRYSLDRTTE